MAFDFKGKVAFITGGGTGIGAAVAQAFVQGGGRVVLMGRRRQPLQAVADPLGGLVVEGDAANADDVRVALARAQEQFGGVDVLVANAGGHGLGELTQTSDASWQESTRLNLDTAFVCCRELMPQLIERRGNIVILSSLAGHFAGPAVVGYVTMKHALIGLTVVRGSAPMRYALAGSELRWPIRKWSGSPNSANCPILTVLMRW